MDNNCPAIGSVTNISYGKTIERAGSVKQANGSEAIESICTALASLEAANCSWYCIDLLDDYPIERIVVRDCSGGVPEEIQLLVVQISRDNKHWSNVHAAPDQSAADATNIILDLQLTGEICARYVRFASSETNGPSPIQMDVFVLTAILGFVAFRKQHGLVNLVLKAEDPTRPDFSLYSLEMGEVNASDPNMPIIGLKLNHSGRFGNLLHQYMNLITIAEKTGLKYIQLGYHELSNLEAPIVIGNITFFQSTNLFPLAAHFSQGAFLIPHHSNRFSIHF